jgi:hypothetical protein
MTTTCQALDLLFIGALTTLKAIAQGEFDDDSANNQITNIPQAYKQTTTSIPIHASFGKPGLVSNTSSRPFGLRFIEEEVRENAGFKQIWDRNINIRELSRMQQDQRLGVVNSEFMME